MSHTLAPDWRNYLWHKVAPFVRETPVSFASEIIVLSDVKRSSEKPKIITEPIDRLEQFREGLFTIQRRLENFENRESAVQNERIPRSTTPVNYSNPRLAGSMSAIAIFRQPRSTASCKSCGSAYPSGSDRATDVEGCIRPNPRRSWVLSQGSCSIPAPCRLGRNTPYARCLVVTDHWSPHWLGNENDRGRRGVWVCGGCATRHHWSACCQLDAGSRDPHHDFLVQLYLVYHLGGGRIAAACALRCETPNCTAAPRPLGSALASSRRAAANSILCPHPSVIP
jgi:hypothetical protein